VTRRMIKSEKGSVFFCSWESNTGTAQGGQTWHGQTLGGQLSCKKSSVYVLFKPSKESGWDLFWLGLVLARLVTVRDL
jgi:hypothetical protein